MKKYINFFTTSFIFALILCSNFSTAESGLYSSTLKNDVLMANSTNQISWNAVTNAVIYKIEIKNTATQESTEVETTATQLSLLGLPAGSYSITVTAMLASGSSSIIMEDIVAV